jgi:plastocyanin
MNASDPLIITAFDPSPVNLPIGSSVTWINNDAVLHTATSFDGSFDSGIIPPGGNFTHTFSKMGYYTYYCRLHPNMNGIIAIG